MRGPGAGNPFRAAVQRGAEEQDTEPGVKIVVLSPLTESGVPAQIAQIEDQLAKGVGGIVLPPPDPNALAPVVDEATADGAPVAFINTKGSNDGITYIGTDNEMGAALAARHIGDNVTECSDVANLKGIITQSTGKARADGSYAGLDAGGLNIVAAQTGERDRDRGMAVMENIITGDQNLKAVFASTDNMGHGAIEALKNADMLDDVFVVGFDANPDAAASVLADKMSATVAQNP